MVDSVQTLISRWKGQSWLFDAIMAGYDSITLRIMFMWRSCVLNHRLILSSAISTHRLYCFQSRPAKAWAQQLRNRWNRKQNSAWHTIKKRRFHPSPSTKYDISEWRAGNLPKFPICWKMPLLLESVNFYNSSVQISFTQGSQVASLQLSQPVASGDQWATHSVGHDIWLFDPVVENYTKIAIDLEQRKQYFRRNMIHILNRILPETTAGEYMDNLNVVWIPLILHCLLLVIYPPWGGVAGSRYGLYFRRCGHANDVVILWIVLHTFLISHCIYGQNSA